MQDFLTVLSGNIDTLSLSIATGIATGIVFALKALFFLARKLAKKTTVVIDDRIIDETETALKNKCKDI